MTQTAYGTTVSGAGFQTLQAGGLAPGCVPLDLFGEGVTSQAALNYVAPGRTNDGVADQALYRMNQQVFSVSSSGTLPWGLAAGKPAIALGFEDRLEQQRNSASATRWELALRAYGNRATFSQFPADCYPGRQLACTACVYGKGAYNVQEGFLEVDVPLLKNQIVDDLNFNAAGRMTGYSSSGLVETWKLGLTSQVNEDIKLRTTLSSDIRAPGIGELFSPILVSTWSDVQSYPPTAGSPTFQVRRAPGG